MSSLGNPALADQGVILIVSFFYAPMLNARAFRWTALAEAWAAQGRNVSVVCSSAPGLPPFETRNGVKVYRTEQRRLERLRTVFDQRRRGGLTATSPAPSRAGPQRSMRLGAARFLVNAWRRLYWPDGSCLWHFAAVDQARALLSSSPGASLITVSPTFTAVAAGYSLVRSSARPRRWLIDMGDPFCFANEAPPNNFRVYGRLNRWFERRCFAKADAISVTNEPTAARYRALFPESAGKISVIPPLLSGQGTCPGSGSGGIAAGEPSIRIVYLGTLYRRIRRPDLLLSLVAQAQRRWPDDRLELHFYGNTDECQEAFLPYSHLQGSALFIHGVVPREQAFQAMHAASILVSIGNDTAYQLPSKLVEYAATGKPILCISTLENDSSVDFLRDYPASLSLLDRGEPPDEEQLEAFSRFVRGGARPVERETLREWLSPYRLDSVLGRYSALLDP